MIIDGITYGRIVYVDWKDGQFEPEIIGVYLDDGKASEVREAKEDELRSEGYDTNDEVIVWVEDVSIE